MTTPQFTTGALSSNGDDVNLSYLVHDREAVAVCVQMIMDSQLGDWFLDNTFGIDYFGTFRYTTDLNFIVNTVETTIFTRLPQSVVSVNFNILDQRNSPPLPPTLLLAGSVLTVYTNEDIPIVYNLEQ